jgi:hypothetical protein
MSSGCSGTSEIVPEPSRSSIIFLFSCISSRLCQIPNLESMLQVLRVAAFRKCMLAGRRSIPFRATRKFETGDHGKPEFGTVVEIT